MCGIQVFLLSCPGVYCKSVVKVGKVRVWAVGGYALAGLVTGCGGQVGKDGGKWATLGYSTCSQAAKDDLGCLAIDHEKTHDITVVVQCGGKVQVEFVVDLFKGFQEWSVEALALVEAQDKLGRAGTALSV